MFNLNELYGISYTLCIASNNGHLSPFVSFSFTFSIFISLSLNILLLSPDVQHPILLYGLSAVGGGSGEPPCIEHKLIYIYIYNMESVDRIRMH